MLGGGAFLFGASLDLGCWILELLLGRFSWRDWEAKFLGPAQDY